MKRAAARAALISEGLALVIVAHETVEDAHTPARAPARLARIILAAHAAHRRAGDVDMAPGLVIDEALQELRRRDRTGETALTDILDVGILGLDVFLLVRAERHAPDRLVGGIAGRGQLGGDFVGRGWRVRILGMQRA